MSRVVIARAATLSALGEGLTATWKGLLDGRSGISSLTRFDCCNYLSNQAACIEGLDASAVGSRLDTILERIAGQLGPLPADCRLLVASTKGEIDKLTDACRAGAPLPASVLFEPLLAKIARRFGLADGGSNINAACASSTVAVARAAAMIASGAAEVVLVYAADLVSEFVFSGFSALQALAAEPCRPFDRERSGLTLGEAGVALLLMSETRAATAGEQPLARVAGWGGANDAHHVTAPARDGSGLVRACRLALAQAKIDPGQVAGINAHGTGTVYNDAMELVAFENVFGEQLPPLHGVKGSLGHCLGAAGGLEIAIGCQALREQRLPGSVGCQQPEEAARGRVAAAEQPINGDYLLCSNSGFGGINGVVILQRGEL